MTLTDALKAFVLGLPTHQSAKHIKRMHWYVACRLVLEGGFDPETITPRPPFRVQKSRGASGTRFVLHHDDDVAGSGERAVLGGLKTKNVDVVVAIDGIGPCVAVSLKGTLNAYRNLTNRLEEAVGDCTNIHIAYPALVYGFLHLIRVNHEGPVPENGRRFLQADSSGNVKVRTSPLRRLERSLLVFGDITMLFQDWREGATFGTTSPDMKHWGWS